MKALFWLYLLVFPGALQPGNTLNQAIDQYENGAYRKSIALLSPDNPDVSAEKLLWLGKTYLKIREWDKAVQFMEKAVKLEPSNALYHLWLGRAYGSRAENRFFGFNDARRLKNWHRTISIFVSTSSNSMLRHPESSEAVKTRHGRKLKRSPNWIRQSVILLAPQYTREKKSGTWPGKNTSRRFKNFPTMLTSTKILPSTF
jgi:tetratricopeptide (TPR) repeat protein